MTARLVSQPPPRWEGQCIGSCCQVIHRRFFGRKSGILSRKPPCTRPGSSTAWEQPQKQLPHFRALRTRPRTMRENGSFESASWRVAGGDTNREDLTVNGKLGVPANQPELRNGFAAKGQRAQSPAAGRSLGRLETVPSQSRFTSAPLPPLRPCAAEHGNSGAESAHPNAPRVRGFASALLNGKLPPPPAIAAAEECPAAPKFPFPSHAPLPSSSPL